MHAHYLQHVPFEGLGSIEGWLTGAGYRITHTPLFSSQALPELEGVDLLIVMGGPMSVNDEQAYPWLSAEKRFIRRAIESGIPTLGICLGAQLIASALGARVYPNPEKEIGWFPVSPVVHDEPGGFRFPETIEVFHWHGETFDLPPGAVPFARSEGCRNQAFQLGARVIGLQFHLETTRDSAATIIDHCRDELQPGRYIQQEGEILSAPPQAYRAINELMGEVLAYLHPAGG